MSDLKKEPGTRPMLYAVRGEARLVEFCEERRIYDRVTIQMEALRDTPPIPPSVALHDTSNERGLDYLPTILTLEEAHAVARGLHENGLSSGGTRWARAVADFRNVTIYGLTLPLETNGNRIPAPLTSFGGDRDEAIWDEEVGGLHILARVHLRGYDYHTEPRDE